MKKFIAPLLVAVGLVAFYGSLPEIDILTAQVNTGFTAPNGKLAKVGDATKNGMRLGGPCASVLSRAVINITSVIGNTQLVAPVTSSTVFVCNIIVVATDVQTWSLVTGHGTACATSEVAMTGTMDFVGPAGLVVPNTGAIQTLGNINEGVCIKTTTNNHYGGWMLYWQTATP